MIIEAYARAKGVSIPRWYGYCYPLLDRDADVYYLIPVNYIVRYWRRCRLRFLKCFYWVGLIDYVPGEWFTWNQFWRIKSH